MTAADGPTTMNATGRRPTTGPKITTIVWLCVLGVLVVLGPLRGSVAVVVSGQAGGGDLRVTNVREHLQMLTGAGGNIAVLVFPEGVTLVDSGRLEMSDKVLATVRTLSPQPIRYIINTSADPDHTGGNEKVGATGGQITGGNVAGQVSDAADGAEIIAHENVLERMTAPSVKPPLPIRMTPGTTYHTAHLKLSTFYHGDGIELFAAPAAHSDGDTLVYFRRNDVLVTGDVFVPNSYPVIDLARGGSINGEIDALNHVIDLAFPEFRLEGGTLIVPGHGRLCDSADVAYYRDMVTIVRDRVQDLLKKAMTLEQVKAATVTREYDGLYGKNPSWTPDMFVESIYKSLSAGMKPAAAAKPAAPPRSTPIKK
jgi:glyoxylase-like metal-dependent hydrolase (beta-lactamase superfamily II)